MLDSGQATWSPRQRRLDNVHDHGKSSRFHFLVLKSNTCFSKIFYTVFIAGACIVRVLNFDPAQVEHSNAAIKWFVVAEVFYILSALLFKISLGIFFLRMPLEAWQRRKVCIIVAILSMFSFISIFTTIFLCGKPNTRQEDTSAHGNHRYSTPAAVLGVGYTHALIIAVSDILFVVLPLCILWKTQLQMKELVRVGSILVIACL